MNGKKVVAVLAVVMAVAVIGSAGVTLKGGVISETLKSGAKDAKCALPGDTLNVAYWVRALSTDGRHLVNPPKQVPPFDFVLGEGEVIPGWDIGLPGMCVGETRSLVVPPELAFRDQAMGSIQDKPNYIPANSTVYFEVKLWRLDAGMGHPRETSASQAILILILILVVSASGWYAFKLLKTPSVATKDKKDKKKKK